MECRCDQHVKWLQIWVVSGHFSYCVASLFGTARSQARQQLCNKSYSIFVKRIFTYNFCYHIYRVVLIEPRGQFWAVSLILLMLRGVSNILFVLFYIQGDLININIANLAKIGLIVGLWHWLINESADLHNDQAQLRFLAFFFNWKLKFKHQRSTSNLSR